MGSVLMAIEGVMADDMEGGSLVGAQALPSGLQLFHALRTQFQMILSTRNEKDHALAFLRVYGIRMADFANLFVGEEIAVLREARREHYSPEYMVTANPAVAVAALGFSVTPLCCPHPVYAQTSFLPYSAEGKALWNDIIAAHGAQVASFADDERRESDDEVSFED